MNETLCKLVSRIGWSCDHLTPRREVHVRSTLVVVGWSGCTSKFRCGWLVLVCDCGGEELVGLADQITVPETNQSACPQQGWLVW